MRRGSKREAALSEDLNLIPYLDIVVNLVMFLLLATNFGSELFQIAIPAKQTGPPGAGEDLGVTVAIDRSGYYVIGAGAWQKDIPREGVELDTSALSAHLASVAPVNVELPQMTITAPDDEELAVVVRTIDAVSVRPDGSELFRSVGLAKVLTVN